MSLGQRIKQLREAKGWSQGRLAREVSREGYPVSQQAISKIEMDESERPRSLVEIARTLGTSEAYLREETDDPQLVENAGVSAVQPQPKVLPATDGFDINFRIPVYSRGLDGRMKIRKGQEARKIAAPAQLQGVKGAFGVHIYDDLMSPYVEIGEVVIADPTLPPTDGDTCLFVKDKADGSQEAIARKLVRSSAQRWRVKQYQPSPQESDLPRSEWRAHPILWRGSV